jgi:Co/Zn/Cd efflux system component
MARHHILTFENKHQKMLGRSAFVRRLALNFGVGTALVGISLLGGMIGYHLTEDMIWIDAFANASMILSGMGPLDPPKTWGGKLFAGLYALYSGLVLILAAGIVLAPVVHRLFHSFHLDEGRTA